MAANYFPHNAVITVNTNNPKRPGTAAAARYAKYRTGQTVAEALKAGLLTIDFSFDSARGYITVTAANGQVIPPPAAAVKAAGKAANPLTGPRVDAMTPRLDRRLQGRILRALATVYPDQIELDETLPDDDPQLVVMNLHYLCEHGLAETKWSQLLSGPPIPGAVRITARGMDFLADDGGLSEVLGVVTVKLHGDTLKALLIERINASSESASMKTRLIDQAKSEVLPESLRIDEMHLILLVAQKFAKAGVVVEKHSLFVHDD